MDLPKGVLDRRVCDACRCFVRVGHHCFGSILGTILESFWELHSLLYSFLVAPGAKTGILLGDEISSRIWSPKNRRCSAVEGGQGERSAAQVDPLELKLTQSTLHEFGLRRPARPATSADVRRI